MKRVNSRWSILLALGLFAMARQAYAAEPAKVRLFILSGQSNMSNMDPNESFTPTLKKAYPNDELIVVREAAGGLPIRRWYKAWKIPPGYVISDIESKNPGNYYDRLMKSVNKAIKGKKLDTITFVWMQGERDAKDKLSAIYAESLQGVIQQLRGDLKRPDIAIVIGRISDCEKGEQHWDAVRAAQEKVAKDDPRAAWIDTDDLNGPKNDLHYTKEGYTLLGRRFAEKAIELNSK